MPRISAPRLVFEDGELSIESFGLADAVPVDPLSVAPDRFVYTGYRNIVLSAGRGAAEYGRIVFARGGGKCRYASADGVPFGDFSFTAQSLSETWDTLRSEHHVTIMGTLHEASVAGRLVSDDMNSRYSFMYRASRPVLTEGGDLNDWGDDPWDE